ncbi:MAG: glycosyltransferase family 39 protein [Chloroflexi bacterium]|nr:glycosyltransferase family 39 protein [Chloroflexota bacterium]
MRRAQIIPVIALLLLHFFIRTHHILGLDPYLDEGFHVSRGAFVWDLDVNPGRISEGKFLLYYWLGIFEAPSTQALAPARLSMALFSLFSGATIFLMGRWLVNYKTGLVALGLYAILPLAYFLERMAMADPFAAAWATLLAWRSLAFVKHPTIPRAIPLGILMALVTMAKLTMGLVPILPIAASFIYWQWEKGRFMPQAWAWLKTYFVPLGVAGLVSLACWSPILIPAYLTRNSDHPITLVDTYNIKTVNPDEHTLGEYFWGVVPIVSEFTTKELLLVSLLAAGYWLGAGRNNARQLRNGVYVIAWLLTMGAPTLYIATIITSRYMMPLAAPIALMVAYLLMSLWDSKFLTPIVRLGVVSVAALWIVNFAYPFTSDTLNDPLKLPLTGTSLVEYLSGYISGDIAIQQAGAALDELNPKPERIYVNWSICPLVYFYTHQDLICLDRNNILSTLSEHFQNEMPDCGESIFVVSGYPDSVLNVYGIKWEFITSYQRARVNRPVKIYRATWQDKCTLNKSDDVHILGH